MNNSSDRYIRSELKTKKTLERRRYLESTEKDDSETSDNKILESKEKNKIPESMEKNKNSLISGETPTNKRRNEEDNFVSEYVSIPAAEGLKITIKQSDSPQAIKRNIIEYESGSDISEQGNRTPELQQKTVVSIEHHLSPQPKEMTLSDGRTQPLPRTAAGHICRNPRWAQSPRWTQNRLWKLLLPNPIAHSHYRGQKKLG